MENQKIINRYMAKCKSLFPIIKKEEKEYLSRLKYDIIEFTYDEHIDSIDELYSQFGTPSDILQNYYSMHDTYLIIKKIRFYTTIKRIISLSLIFTFVSVSFFDYNLYHSYKMFVNTQIASYSEMIK